MPGKKSGKVTRAGKPFLKEEQSAFAKASQGKAKVKGKKAKVAKKTAKVTEKTAEVIVKTAKVQEATFKDENGESPVLPLTIEKLRFLRRNTRSYQEAVEVILAKFNWTCGPRRADRPVDHG